MLLIQQCRDVGLKVNSAMNKQTLIDKLAEASKRDITAAVSSARPTRKRKRASFDEEAGIDDGDDYGDDGDDVDDDDDDDDDAINLLQNQREDAQQQLNEYKEQFGEEFELDLEFKSANSKSPSSTTASEFERDLVKPDVLCDRLILYRWKEGWEACKIIANCREAKFNYVMRDRAGEKPCTQTNVQLFILKCLSSLSQLKDVPSSWIPLKLIVR